MITNTFLRRARLLVTVFLIPCVPLGAYANESGQEAPEHFERHGRHALGLFFGITREHGHNRETIGIEYSYRINRYWTVGGLVERAERDQSSTLTNFFVHFWATEALYFGGGLGRKDPGEERRTTYRATIGYEFEVAENWFVEPQFHYDWIEEEDNEEVIGIAIGRKF